jgi:O-antigen/teichoic acid export membrane protein
MATLAIGSGAARAIGIATIPILSRLYSPEDFGALAVFTALVAVIAPLATLRYALALPLPRQDGMAMNLLALSGCLIVGLSMLLALVLGFWAAPLLGLLSMQVLAPWWWLIVLGVLGTATYELLTLWATRRRSYKLMAQTQVAQSAAGSLVKIVLGMAALQPAGLLIGQTVAQAGGTVRLWQGFLPEFQSSWRHVRLARIGQAALHHRGFPLWRAPAQLLLMFSMQAPVLIIAALYDSEATGQFGMAMMAVVMPMTVLGGSMSRAVYGEAASIGTRAPDRLFRLIVQSQIRLLLLSLVPASTLFFLGPRLFAVILGDQWFVAGEYASVLAVLLFFQFSSAPLMQILNLLGRQKVFLLVNLLRAALTVCAGGFASVACLESSEFVLAYTVLMTPVYIALSVFIVESFRRLSMRSR